MSASSAETYRSLSLKARLAVALYCVERFCEATGLQHPKLASFLNHMWELPSCTSFPNWDSRKDDLVLAGLGDSIPADIVSVLSSVDVPEQSFRQLVENVVEIAYGSAYGRSDHEGSLRHLDEVFRIVALAGITPPPAEPFASPALPDDQCWGTVSPQRRDEWRFHPNDQKRHNQLP
jgi:hypothetical protein